MNILKCRITLLVVISTFTTAQFAAGSAGRIFTGADATAGGPHVKAFASRTQTNVASFFAYTPTFAGGVRVGLATSMETGQQTSLLVPDPERHM